MMDERARVAPRTPPDGGSSVGSPGGATPPSAVGESAAATSMPARGGTIDGASQETGGERQKANKALVRRGLEEVNSLGDPSLVDQIFAPDLLFYSHAHPEPAHGPEGVKDFVTMLRTAFPDLWITIEDLVAEGDRVVARWTVRATHNGPLLGMPPTGRPMTERALEYFRICDGKISEAYLVLNALGVLQQLGVIPDPQKIPRPVMWAMGRMQQLGARRRQRAAPR
jgi:steroid delta-isomerase-like uncharacterized protein